jgi:hypothetical protein
MLQVIDKNGNVYGDGPITISSKDGKTKTTSTNIVVDTTNILNGVDQRILFDDEGKLGEANSVTWDKLRNTLTIVGTLAATVKSFIIDHPIKKNHKLQYGVLEGPEHAVYNRGKLVNEKVIYLPYYWNKLVHTDTISVTLTSIGKPVNLWVQEICSNYIVIDSDQEEFSCFYTVFGERKDIDKLVTEIRNA